MEAPPTGGDFSYFPRIEMQHRLSSLLGDAGELGAPCGVREMPPSFGSLPFVL